MPGHPNWTDDELADRREHEIAAFVRTWGPAMGDRYREIYAEARGELDELMEASDALLELDRDQSFFDARRDLVPAGCATAAPFISEDNYKVLAKAMGGTPLIRAMIDIVRFPWMETGNTRTPSDAEIEAATHATAAQIAERRLDTERRVTASRVQEKQTRDYLETKVGLDFVPAADIRDRLEGTPRYDGAKGIQSHNLDLALQRGEFTSELLVAGTKCDIPIRLRTGGLLPLECKVSNSATNSTKRLIREVCGKAPAWRAGFGQETLIAGLIAGVFSLKNLKDAQNDHRIMLFFGHELDALGEFFDNGETPRP